MHFPTYRNVRNTPFDILVVKHCLGREKIQNEFFDRVTVLKRKINIRMMVVMVM